MKKSLFSLLTLSFLFTTLFTSCLGDGANKISSSNWMVTITGSDGLNIFYEVDGSKGVYFYSEEITNSLIPLNVGDRVYLTKLTIDYDNQPAGANGSSTKPYLMTNVTFEKIELSNIVGSQGIPSDAVDKLSYFEYPYIVSTSQGYYMNLAGKFPKDAKPVFYLSTNGMKNDTIIYDLKQKYEGTSTSIETELFINTYKVYISGSKYIKIYFNSKEKSSYITYPNFVVIENTDNTDNVKN